MTPALRRARERVILQIIEEEPIRTQTGLVEALERRGVSVTQATVSRDIQRLGIVKLRVKGGARYVRPDLDRPAPVARRVLEVALREFALEISPGDALLAVRTQSGCANAVAVAIDESEMDGVVATLAGDDSILVLCRDAPDRSRVMAELQTLGEF